MINTLSTVSALVSAICAVVGFGAWWVCNDSLMRVMFLFAAAAIFIAKIFLGLDNND